jgi:DNA transposition AAA+ family ATPase
MNLSNEFKKEVLSELLNARKNFDGSGAAFARQYGISASVFSRIKNGETDKMLADAQWLQIGRVLGVQPNKRKWNVAKTDVFDVIKEEVLFCKEHSKARMFVDACGIGKTFTARYLSKTVKNCFYVDASQARTKMEFVKLIARTIGVPDSGYYVRILEDIKYYLHVIPQPVIIIDEAGDLDYGAFLELKSLWNATENVCGWYLMGAEGFKAKVERGIKSQRVGFREIFSRFSERYRSVVPMDKQEQTAFYRKLLTEILSVNCDNKALVSTIVTKCLVRVDGVISGLRRAESLLILSQKSDENV